MQIATSNSDGYALTSNGTVWAWGVASYGELGNGEAPAYSTRAVKVDFPAGVRITRWPTRCPSTVRWRSTPMATSGGGVSMPSATSACPASRSCVRVSFPLSGVTLATGARTHSLFDSGGKVYACGSGQYGVLGTGSTANSSTPVPVIGLPSTGGDGAHLVVGGFGALLSNGDLLRLGLQRRRSARQRHDRRQCRTGAVMLPGSRATGVPGRKRSQERPDRRHLGQRLGVGLGRQRPGTAR